MADTGLKVTIKELELLKTRISELHAKRQFTLSIKLGKSYNRLEEFTSKLREVQSTLKSLEKEDVSVSVAKNVATAFKRMQESISNILKDTKKLTQELNQVKNAAQKVRDDIANAGQPKDTGTLKSQASEIERRNTAADKYAKIMDKNFAALQRSNRAAKTWSQYLKGVYKVTNDVTDAQYGLTKKIRVFYKVLSNSKAFRPATGAIKTFAAAINKATLGLSNLIYWQVRWYATKNIIFGMSAIVRDGVTAWIEFDQELKNIKSVANATDAQLRILEVTMREVASSTRFSLTELATATTVLVQSGLSIREAQSALPAVANLATATMTDLTTTTNLVTSTMRAFNVELGDLAHTADIFANAVSNSKLTVDKIAVAFNYVGPVAQQVGLSLEDTAATLGLLANKGIQASTIGTSLRTLFGALLAPTDKFKKSLAKVGLSVSDLNPQMHDFGKIMKTLKTSGINVADVFEGLDRRAAGALAALIDSGAEAFEHMRDAMGETGAAARKAEIQLTGISQITKNLKDNVQLLTTAVIDSAIGDKFAKVLDNIRRRIKSLNMFAEDFPELFSAKIGSALESAGTVLVYIMGIIGGLAGLKFASVFKTSAFGALRTVKFFGLAKLVSGPWGLAFSVAASGLAYLFAKKYASKQKKYLSKELVKNNTADFTKEINEAANKRIQFTNLRNEIKAVQEELRSGSLKTYEADDKIRKILEKNKDLLAASAEKGLELANINYVDNLKEYGQELNKNVISAEKIISTLERTIDTTELKRALADLQGAAFETTPAPIKSAIISASRFKDAETTGSRVETLNSSRKDLENLVIDLEKVKAQKLESRIVIAYGEYGDQEIQNIDKFISKLKALLNNSVADNKLLVKIQDLITITEIKQFSSANKSKIARSLTTIQKEFQQSVQEAVSTGSLEIDLKNDESLFIDILDTFVKRLKTSEIWNTLSTEVTTQLTNAINLKPGETLQLTEASPLKGFFDIYLETAATEQDKAINTLEKRLTKFKDQSIVAIMAARNRLNDAIKPIKFEGDVFSQSFNFDHIKREISDLEARTTEYNKIIETLTSDREKIIDDANKKVYTDEITKLTKAAKDFTISADALKHVSTELGNNLQEYGQLRGLIRNELGALRKLDTVDQGDLKKVAKDTSVAFSEVVDTLKILSKGGAQGKKDLVDFGKSLYENTAIVATIGTDKLRTLNATINSLSEEASDSEVAAALQITVDALRRVATASAAASIRLELIGGDEIVKIISNVNSELIGLAPAARTADDAFRLLKTGMSIAINKVKRFGAALKETLNIQKETDSAIGRFLASNDVDALTSKLDEAFEERQEITIDISVSQKSISDYAMLYKNLGDIRDNTDKRAVDGALEYLATQNTSIEFSKLLLALRGKYGDQLDKELQQLQKIITAEWDNNVIIQKRKAQITERINLYQRELQLSTSMLTVETLRSNELELQNASYASQLVNQQQLTELIRQNALDLDVLPIGLGTQEQNKQYKDLQYQLQDLGIQYEHNTKLRMFYTREENTYATKVSSNIRELKSAQIDLEAFNTLVALDTNERNKEKDDAHRRELESLVAQLTKTKELNNTEVKRFQELLLGLKLSNTELDLQKDNIKSMLKQLEKFNNIWEGPKQGVMDFIKVVRSLGEVLKDVVSGALTGLADTTTKILNDLAFGIREHNALMKVEKDRALEEQLQGYDKEYNALKLKLVLKEVDQQQYHEALVLMNAKSAKERTAIEKKYDSDKRDMWQSSKQAFADYARTLVRTSLKMINEFIAQRLLLIAINTIAGLAGNPSTKNLYNPALTKGIRQPLAYAEGGEIPSTSTSIANRDSVPVLTMPGEYIIQKSSVDKYGPDFMSRLNTGILDPRKLPKYAEGGLISSSGKSSHTVSGPTDRVIKIYNFIDPSSLPQQPSQDDIINVVSLDALQNGPGIQTIRQRLRG